MCISLTDLKLDCFRFNMIFKICVILSLALMAASLPSQLENDLDYKDDPSKADFEEQQPVPNSAEVKCSNEIRKLEKKIEDLIEIINEILSENEAYPGRENGKEKVEKRTQSLGVLISRWMRNHGGGRHFNFSDFWKQFGRK